MVYLIRSWKIVILHLIQYTVLPVVPVSLLMSPMMRASVLCAEMEIWSLERVAIEPLTSIVITLALAVSLHTCSVETEVVLCVAMVSSTQERSVIVCSQTALRIVPVIRVGSVMVQGDVLSVVTAYLTSTNIVTPRVLTVIATVPLVHPVMCQQRTVLVRVLNVEMVLSMQESNATPLTLIVFLIVPPVCSSRRLTLSGIVLAVVTAISMMVNNAILPLLLVVTLIAVVVVQVLYLIRTGTARVAPVVTQLLNLMRPVILLLTQTVILIVLVVSILI